mmetsp:Transcript_2867/g.6101  ORF Transcript_2867/g.6101 Transcript_2867/m.6101 type:complete len:200 (+) Transcript_2867:399-998(+)
MHVHSLNAHKLRRADAPEQAFATAFTAASTAASAAAFTAAPAAASTAASAAASAAATAAATTMTYAGGGGGDGDEHSSTAHLEAPERCNLDWGDVHRPLLGADGAQATGEVAEGRVQRHRPLVHPGRGHLVLGGNLVVVLELGDLPLEGVVNLHRSWQLDRFVRFFEKDTHLAQLALPSPAPCCRTRCGCGPAIVIGTA